ncbi:MAG TPA: hypothetical protein VFO10_31240 [Oligoflexus sp.]|uniref:hypothetical protein n=1 Tax=Oligoflexus sp. TaxID=1971216 RepID=UPI002D7FC802|nr:hypothetical protein [Oligoflexus sp.]HET9241785.1 hypothetical protein [Oligoflexus sp.]
MKPGLKISILCVLALSIPACEKKSARKEATTELPGPVTPPGVQPGTNPKCPLSVAYHPKKGYLTNLFRATSYDHPEIKRLGLKERLTLLDQCKEERKLIKQNSAS